MHEIIIFPVQNLTTYLIYKPYWETKKTLKIFGRKIWNVWQLQTKLFGLMIDTYHEKLNPRNCKNKNHRRKKRRGNLIFNFTFFSADSKILSESIYCLCQRKKTSVFLLVENNWKHTFWNSKLKWSHKFNTQKLKTRTFSGLVVWKLFKYGWFE